VTQDTGARVDVYPACCPQSTDRVVRVSGMPASIAQCIFGLHTLLQQVVVSVTLTVGNNSRALQLKKLSLTVCSLICYQQRPETNFLSGMHHWECVAPNVDTSLQSGWFLHRDKLGKSRVIVLTHGKSTLVNRLGEVCSHWELSGLCIKLFTGHKKAFTVINPSTICRAS